MTEQELFSVVGIREPERTGLPFKKQRSDFPWVSASILILLSLCCLLAEALMTKDPTYLDLLNCNVSPNREFLFGTDSLGRDLFSGIWYGGRISLCIGFLSTLISTAFAILYGTISGLAPKKVDTWMMRFAEILLSVPELLLVLFLQAILGEANVLTLSIVIGLTSWPGIAKLVRTQVQQLRGCEYVIAAKCMGGSFLHILFRHLAPNFIAEIMFMVVMNVRSAIASESTLSFLGMGLPVEIISWGSMLSLAQNALLQRSWWVILIPGAFLIVLLMTLTSLGNYLRKNANRKESNL